MYRTLAVLAVCLLAFAVAFGQSSTDQQQQSHSSAAQQQQAPSPSQQSQPQQSQPQQDRSASGSTAGSASGSVSTRQGDQSNPSSDQPARAANRSGIPLTWLIIGGIVLVLVIIAVATRGSSTVVDRSERVEHHDDIRRAG